MQLVANTTLYDGFLSARRAFESCQRATIHRLSISMERNYCELFRIYAPPIYKIMSYDQKNRYNDFISLYEKLCNLLLRICFGSFYFPFARKRNYSNYFTQIDPGCLLKELMVKGIRLNTPFI